MNNRLLNTIIPTVNRSGAQINVNDAPNAKGPSSRRDVNGIFIGNISHSLAKESCTIKIKWGSLELPKHHFVKIMLNK